MPPKSLEQRLFGAACVRRQLELQGSDAHEHPVYEGVLEDLSLEDEQVVEFLAENRERVDEALAKGRRSVLH